MTTCDYCERKFLIRTRSGLCSNCRKSPSVRRIMNLEVNMEHEDKIRNESSKGAQSKPTFHSVKKHPSNRDPIPLRETTIFKTYMKQGVDSSRCYFSNESFKRGSLPFICHHCGFKFVSTFRLPENHECMELARRQIEYRNSVPIEVFSDEIMLQKLREIQGIHARLTNSIELGVNEDEDSSLKLRLARLYSAIHRPGLSLELIQEVIRDTPEIIELPEIPENPYEENSPEWDAVFDLADLWRFQSSLQKRLMRFWECFQSLQHSIKLALNNPFMNPILEKLRLQELRDFMGSTLPEEDEVVNEILRHVRKTSQGKSKNSDKSDADLYS